MQGRGLSGGTDDSHQPYFAVIHSADERCLAPSLPPPLLTSRRWGRRNWNLPEAHAPDPALSLQAAPAATPAAATDPAPAVPAADTEMQDAASASTSSSSALTGMRSIGCMRITECVCIGFVVRRGEGGLRCRPTSQLVMLPNVEAICVAALPPLLILLPPLTCRQVRAGWPAHAQGPQRRLGALRRLGEAGTDGAEV